MWIKKPYKNGKGFRFMWQSTEDSLSYFDESCLNRPRAYTTEYCISNRKAIRARQYSKNPKSVLALKSPFGNKGRIVEKRVEQISLSDKAKFLNDCNFPKDERLLVDYRNMGLAKYGFRVELCRKHYNAVERLFGYKAKTIHKLTPNTPQEIVEEIHKKYLSKLFEMVD